MYICIYIHIYIHVFHLCRYMHAYMHAYVQWGLPTGTIGRRPNAQRCVGWQIDARCPDPVGGIVSANSLFDGFESRELGFIQVAGRFFGAFGVYCDFCVQGFLSRL